MRLRLPEARRSAGDRRWRRRAASLVLLSTLVLSSAVRADVHVVGPPAFDANQGIGCAATYPLWHSVWLGHFSGGAPIPVSTEPQFIAWVDAKLCFPSRHSCQAWIGDFRRHLHRPEGFWTCLPLR